MKRIGTILFSVTMAAILSLGTVGVVQASKDEIVLRFAETAVPGQPDYVGGLYFIDLVKKMTNGKVKIELYHSGQLGSDKAITQATIAGTIDMAKCSVGNFSEFSKALYFADVPGLFKSKQHVRAVWQSDIRDLMVNRIKSETGLTPIMFDIDGGWTREIGNVKKPVYVPDDTKGLKIRTTGAPVEVALFKAWGASAVPVAWSELYTAMQQKVVDGHYNQPVHTYKVGKFHEIIKYFTFVTQSWCCSVKVMGANAEKKLGPELYKQVIEAGKQAEIYKDSLTDKANQESIDGLKEAEVQIIYLTEKQMKLWNEKSRSIWPQFIGPGKDISQDLVDKVLNLAK